MSKHREVDYRRFANSLLEEFSKIFDFASSKSNRHRSNRNLALIDSGLRSYQCKRKQINRVLDICRNTCWSVPTRCSWSIRHSTRSCVANSIPATPYYLFGAAGNNQPWTHSLIWCFSFLTMKKLSILFLDYLHCCCFSLEVEAVSCQCSVLNEL